MARATVATVVFVITWLALSTNGAAEAGIGQCYTDPKPICTGSGQRPVCVCDVVQNCWWVCK